MPTTSIPRVAVLVAVSLAILTLLVGLAFDPLIHLDHAVARHAYDATFDHGSRIEFWDRVTSWGDPAVMRISMLLGALVLALARQWVLAAWLVGLAVVEAVVAPVAKLLLERARPEWADPITTLGSTSFPSGHATAAAAAATAAVLVVRHLDTPVVVRVLVCWVGVACALAVAASRVFLGVHYLSDVVGGALLGTELAILMYLLAGHVAGRFAVRRSSRRL